VTNGYLEASIRIGDNNTCCSGNYPTAKKLYIIVSPASLERFPRFWGTDKNGKQRWIRRMYHMERTRRILFAGEIRCDSEDLHLELRGDGMWDFNDNQSENEAEFQINVQRRYTLTRTEVLVPPYNVLGGWLWEYPRLGDPGTIRDEWRITREGYPEQDH